MVRIRVYTGLGFNSGLLYRLRTEVPIELRRGSGFRVHGLLQAESFGVYEFKVASEY